MVVLPADLANTPDQDRRRRRSRLAGISPRGGGRNRRTSCARSRAAASPSPARRLPRRHRSRRRRQSLWPLRLRHRRRRQSLRRPRPRRWRPRRRQWPRPRSSPHWLPSRTCGPGDRVILQGQVPLGRERLPRRGPGARPPRGRPARGRGRHGRRRAGSRVRGRPVGLVQAALGEAPGAPGRRRPADLARPGPAGAACRDDGRRGTGRSLDDEPHRRRTRRRSRCHARRPVGPRARQRLLRLLPGLGPVGVGLRLPAAHGAAGPRALRHRRPAVELHPAGAQPTGRAGAHAERPDSEQRAHRPPLRSRPALRAAVGPVRHRGRPHRDLSFRRHRLPRRGPRALPPGARLSRSAPSAGASPTSTA